MIWLKAKGEKRNEKHAQNLTTVGRMPHCCSGGGGLGRLRPE